VSTQARQWTIFYAYTLWSVLVMIAMLAPMLVLLIGAPAIDGIREDPLLGLLLLAQTVTSVLAARGALRDWAAGPPAPRGGRWDLPRLGVLTGGRSWLALTALVALVLGGLTLAGHGSAPVLVVSCIVLAVGALFRVPWTWSAGVLLAALLLVMLGFSAPDLAVIVGVTLAAVFALRPSIWLGAVVRELDDAREVQAQLAVAEERLRFARDLHDVTGRDLSVIAVKSELVAQLAERGDPRTAEHGREVAQIARTSLAEIRALVRGYREADLATELQGTASLLRSAHVEVTVDGAAEDVPAARAGTAAWVLREGGTNILRHADASAVTISLSPHGLTLVNDGAPGDGEVREGSGLTGMRERLDGEARLEVRREDGAFTLDVRFETTGGSR
jgi:two-component system sensor histidine kinase DesK